MTVAEAHGALTRAEQKVTEAQAGVREARDQLDRALADHGWTRLIGGFGADATPLYKSKLYPQALLEVEDILEVLQRQAAA